MKKIILPLAAVSFLFLFFFSVSAHCEHISYVNGSGGVEYSVYHNFNESVLFMHGDWYSADSFLASFASSPKSYYSGDEGYDENPGYFYEYDYVPDINVDLLEVISPGAQYSLVEEPTVFKVKYVGDYGLPLSASYPRLEIYSSSGAPVVSTALIYDSIEDVYYFSQVLPRGEYEYKIFAANEEYQKVKGVYETGETFRVTSKPRDFVKIDPASLTEVPPDNVYFSWTVTTDEPGDVLTYELYLGHETSKSALKKIETSPAPNSLSCVIPSLEHKKRYNWYMRVTNKYGAFLETELFTFTTGGMISKFYNAPNPFNPAKNQNTSFVFAMPETGSAKIALYSEYGDKIWESEEISVPGASSGEIRYNGRDGKGQTLYNGTYIAVLTKKYGGKTKIEKCRILVIK